MPDITMHLTANFYPPIPADIQLSVQEFFDEFVSEADPYIIGWADRPDEWEYEIANEDALNNEWELPNGRIIKAAHMLDELRLWDAVWWDCREPDDSYADHERELAEVPGQMSLFDFDYSEHKWRSNV
jgi:hypothetical protein